MRFLLIFIALNTIIDLGSHRNARWLSDLQTTRYRIVVAMTHGVPSFPQWLHFWDGRTGMCVRVIVCDGHIYVPHGVAAKLSKSLRKTQPRLKITARKFFTSFVSSRLNRAGTTVAQRWV